MTTPFGRNNANKISILVTDQSTETNHTRMENILLPAVTIGSKDLAIGSAQLVKFSSRTLTKLALPLIDRDMVIGTSPSGVRKVVTKRVLITGGTWMK